MRSLILCDLEKGPGVLEIREWVNREDGTQVVFITE